MNLDGEFEELTAQFQTSPLSSSLIDLELQAPFILAQLDVTTKLGKIGKITDCQQRMAAGAAQDRLGALGIFLRYEKQVAVTPGTAADSGSHFQAAFADPSTAQQGELTIEGIPAQGADNQLVMAISRPVGELGKVIDKAGFQAVFAGLIGQRGTIQHTQQAEDEVEQRAQ